MVVQQRKKSVKRMGKTGVARKRRVPVPRVKRLIVVRHSERLDRVFPDILARRRYTRTDANQPANLPIPGRAFSRYRADPPLTVFGRHVPAQLRRSLHMAGIIPSAILSSPALRCVETASLLANGQRVCIEPSLHENWETGGVNPNDACLTPAEFLAAGFPVDVTYRPSQQGVAINRQNTQAFNRRFGHSLDAILASMDSKHPGGTVILVGHSSTLDGVYGHLIEGSMESFDRTGQYIGNFVEEPKYVQSMVLTRTREGGWQYTEGVLDDYTTGTFSTANQLREEEDDEEDGDDE